MKRKHKRFYRGAIFVIAIILILALCLPTFMFVSPPPITP
jgi:hypothetical protein